MARMNIQGAPVLDLTDDIVELTTAIVDIESVSGNEKQLADAVEAALRGQAPHLEVIRDGDTVIARTHRGLPQRLVLAGLLDTVPSAANLPSPLRFREGREELVGRGTCDMKGGVAVMLKLAAEADDAPMDLTWIFYDHEEVAAADNSLTRIAAEHPEYLVGDFAILGEPTSAGVEGGCKGTMKLDVTARGIAAHSGRDWVGDNAIHHLAPVLERLASYRPRRAVIDGLEYREGLNAVAISGGIAGNVIPARARVTLTYRFAPDTSLAQAEARVRGVRLVPGPPGRARSPRVPRGAHRCRQLGRHRRERDPGPGTGDAQLPFRAGHLHRPGRGPCTRGAVGSGPGDRGDRRRRRRPARTGHRPGPAVPGRPRGRGAGGRQTGLDRRLPLLRPGHPRRELRSRRPAAGPHRRRARAAARPAPGARGPAAVPDPRGFLTRAAPGPPRSGRPIPSPHDTGGTRPSPQGTDHAAWQPAAHPHHRPAPARGGRCRGLGPFGPVAGLAHPVRIRRGLRRARRARPGHLPVRLRPDRGGPAAVPDGRRDRQGHRGHGLCGDHRRRARADGGGQPRGEGGRRGLCRSGYRASLRARSEQVRRPRGGLPVLLRPQDHVREVLQRFRGHARRLRHVR